MTEKAIETYLRDQVKKAGGIAYKFTSPGNSGVPDRLVVLPGGYVYFVELKAPSKKPSKLQERQIQRLTELGCNVLVIESKNLVDLLIQHYETECGGIKRE